MTLRHWCLTIASALLLITAACGGDPRTEPVPADTVWSEPGTSAVNDPIDLRERTGDVAYGLPRAGKPSIADLIDIFPTSPGSATSPDIFVAPEFHVTTDRCRGGAPKTVGELPMEIEAVVTLHPRQYQKVTVCGQDERNYGSFTIEDDTGGIVVLRDSRVANYTFGDRVRLKIHAVMLTYGLEIETRAVLVADIAPIEGEDYERVVLYSPLTEAFAPRHASRVFRVEGWVYQVPTNDNFNAMILANEQLPLDARLVNTSGPVLQCVRSCETSCGTTCPTAFGCSDACTDRCLRSYPLIPYAHGACDPADTDDVDADGTPDTCDSCPIHPNPDQADTDNDGVGDRCAAEDTDLDGVPDGFDNCRHDHNTSQSDTDQDGVGNACDICPRDEADRLDPFGRCFDNDNCPNLLNPDQLDTDGDGVGDACDNCPTVPNPDQKDANRDAIGDACLDADLDGDGAANNADNCPFLANPGQADADNDSLGDACDPCPASNLNDADGDDVCEADDVCPTVPDPDQLDSDNDGVGDACDNCPDLANPDQDDACPPPPNDRDADGVPDPADLCPDLADPDQTDTDNDGVGDACDTCPEDPMAAQTDGDGDGLGDACDNCPADPDNDADGDTVCGDLDNCPADPNTDQADTDEDGPGDACDVCPGDEDDDADKDTICGDLDNCPDRFNPAQTDSDGDGLGDVCDLPICWPVGLDAELGRRNYQPAFGRKLRVTGPVVNSYGLQIWVISTGQFEFIDDPPAEGDH